VAYKTKSNSVKIYLWVAWYWWQKTRNKG